MFLDLHNTENIHAKKLFLLGINPFLPEFILFQSNEREVIPDTASLKTTVSTIFVDMAVKVLNVRFINCNLKQVSNILKARDLKCLAFSFFSGCTEKLMDESFLDYQTSNYLIRPPSAILN